MAYKFIISGGGTGGHIFPAVAIANELKNRYPDCEILFIGAKKRMEMEKVPHEGYNIIGLNVQGLKRSYSPKNIAVIWNFIGSFFKAKRILRKFNPDCVIGTGGFASLAVLYAAGKMNYKTLIWEGNGYAGLTNKILAKRVNTICTGFADMESFFPKNKIVFTGNPVRKEILNIPPRQDAIHFFSLNTKKPVIFITGGSLGAKSINKAIQNGLEQLEKEEIQIIWQTGKNFKASITEPKSMKAMIFLREMAQAYAAADLVISRAGALSIAEIAVAGKASILVPSPNVTEDHQTMNAKKLTESGAALLVKDNVVETDLIHSAIALVKSPDKIAEMQNKVTLFARPDATDLIVSEINKLIQL